MTRATLRNAVHLSGTIGNELSLAATTQQTATATKPQLSNTSADWAHGQQSTQPTNTTPTPTEYAVERSSLQPPWAGRTRSATNAKSALVAEELDLLFL